MVRDSKRNSASISDALSKAKLGGGLDSDFTSGLTDDGTPSGGYLDVFQGNATNAFIYASNSPKQVSHDEITNTDKLESTFGVSVIGQFPNNGLSAQTQKIFALLLTRLTRQLPKPGSREITPAKIRAARHIEYTLQEYAEMCGISDLKTARDQLNTAVTSLQGITLVWQEYVYSTPVGEPGKRKRRVLMDNSTPISGQAGIPAQENGKPVVNNVCYFNFSEEFAEYVCRYNYIMPIPRSVFLINTRENPNSLAFLWALSNNTNENYGNQNRRNTITVKTLLSRAPRIPRYKDIVKRGRINELIYKPFDRDLYALVNKYHALAAYEYVTKDGEWIDRAQLGGLTYSEFASLSVRYWMKDYPDASQIERLKKEEAREARRRKAAASKAKADAAGANSGTAQASEPATPTPEQA